MLIPNIYLFTHVKKRSGDIDKGLYLTNVGDVVGKILQTITHILFRSVHAVVKLMSFLALATFPGDENSERG